MKYELEDCVEITSDEYCKLTETHESEFLAQSLMNVVDHSYWMIWRMDGVLYKTFNKPYNYGKLQEV